ncbi:NPCBM/NEW2 domain-containing protein [Lignipirellula cremea]|uniref:NPCBM/NEW2 domain protein n=1 Tax=Lignipirellula cremea TaxID=2528010 RepID=A0A518DNS0_9BACT|nr:NPCBM/NEW2 domain-containing protein [Lignipirellula cremea]QDU93485.1 NPCBM/NEW2 domain protein [Lignipirellula cremea]
MKIAISAVCLMGLVAVTLAPVAGADRQAVLASGERFLGGIGRIDPAGQITFVRPPGAVDDPAEADEQAPGDAAGRERKVALEELAIWGACTDSDLGSQILLVDGSLVLADSFLSWNGDGMSFYSELWGEVTLPLEMVRGVVFQPPTDSLARDQLVQRLRTATGRSDRMLLTNGDELTGVLLEADTSDTTARLPVGLRARPTGATDPVDLQGDRVTAVVLNPALASAPSARGLRTAYGFRNGDLLYASQASAQADRPASPARLTLLGGLELQADADDFFRELNFVQTFGGKTTWLSDLPAAGFRHTPYLRLDWPFHLDRSVVDGELRVGRHRYLKGLGMHTRSRLAFPLGGKFTRFAAEIAVDAKAGRQGSVIFRVYQNQQGEWSPIYQSPVVRGGEQPLPIQLDVTGAAALLLIVDYADRGDELDYADWLNPRLN